MLHVYQIAGDISGCCEQNHLPHLSPPYTCLLNSSADLWVTTNTCLVVTHGCYDMAQLKRRGLGECSSGGTIFEEQERAFVPDT